MCPTWFLPDKRFRWPQVLQAMLARNVKIEHAQELFKQFLKKARTAAPLRRGFDQLVAACGGVAVQSVLAEVVTRLVWFGYVWIVVHSLRRLCAH